MSFKEIAANIAKTLRRRSNYRLVFSTPPGQEVLADLKRFCRPQESSIRIAQGTGMIDTHAMAVQEGRREVFNRILAHLHVSDEELTRLRETADE